MDCNNKKCINQSTNLHNCNKCRNKFCSNKCIIEHVFDYHHNLENNESSLLPYFKKISAKMENSLFIRKGEYLNFKTYDPLYDFKNFEFVRMGKKKQILGSGAFGEVYLVKNKLNGIHYAIKHMYKKKIIEQGANLDIVTREINVHKRLIHENIIRMYSNHEDKNSFYLVIFF